MNDKEIKERLQQAVGVEFESKQTDLLLLHVEHILEWNQKTNLTSITDMDSALVLHVEDSLTALSYVADAMAGKIADIGSGAGFPGIPLAIVSGRECSLVEARTKKTDVLELFIANQQLGDILSTRNMRAEELALIEPGDYAVVTARALSALSVVMELASPLLSVGGTLIAYKGRLDEEEMLAASSIERKLGLEQVDVRDFVLSDGVSHRTLVVYKKMGEAAIALPRRVGMAQKRPLK